MSIKAVDFSLVGLESFKTRWLICPADDIFGAINTGFILVVLMASHSILSLYVIFTHCFSLQNKIPRMDGAGTGHLF